MRKKTGNWISCSFHRIPNGPWNIRSVSIEVELQNNNSLRHKSDRIKRRQFPCLGFQVTLSPSLQSQCCILVSGTGNLLTINIYPIKESFLVEVKCFTIQDIFFPNLVKYGKSKASCLKAYSAWLSEYTHVHRTVPYFPDDYASSFRNWRIDNSF